VTASIEFCLRERRAGGVVRGMNLPLLIALAAVATPADPKPLTPAEEQELQSSCKPLADGLAAWAKQQGQTSATPADVLRTQGAQLAPKMDPKLRAHCADLFIQALALYQLKVIEIEAKMSLKSFATGMAAFYAEQDRLCPSADHPVPARLDQLAAGPYHSTAADWAGAGWKCVGAGDLMAGQPQRFQYDLDSDPKAGTFELTATGRPLASGRTVQLVLHGKAESGSIKLGDVEER
jgi:hypothetical protein